MDLSSIWHYILFSYSIDTKAGLFWLPVSEGLLSDFHCGSYSACGMFASLILFLALSQALLLKVPCLPEAKEVVLKRGYLFPQTNSRPSLEIVEEWNTCFTKALENIKPPKEGQTPFVRRFHVLLLYPSCTRGRLDTSFP